MVGSGSQQDIYFYLFLNDCINERCFAGGQGKVILLMIMNEYCIFRTKRTLSLVYELMSFLFLTESVLIPYFTRLLRNQSASEGLVS